MKGLKESCSILNEEYLLPGSIPMILGFHLLGGTTVKIPKSRFGGRTVVGNFMIAIIGRIEIRSAYYAFNIRMGRSV
jgi:hypothetical protein